MASSVDLFALHAYWCWSTVGEREALMGPRTSLSKHFETISVAATGLPGSRCWTAWDDGGSFRAGWNGSMCLGEIEDGGENLYKPLCTIFEDPVWIPTRPS